MKYHILTMQEREGFYRRSIYLRLVFGHDNENLLSKGTGKNWKKRVYKVSRVAWIPGPPGLVGERHYDYDSFKKSGDEIIKLYETFVQNFTSKGIRV